MCIRQQEKITQADSSSSRRDLVANQEGIYLVFSAITIAVLFAIVALGIEVGRWYAIQAEVSKAVDGAAFAGAANGGNFTPTELETMVKDVAKANFPAGMIGTDSLVVNVVNDGHGKITVDGNIDAINPIASVLGSGHEKTKVGALGEAKLRKFEIVLVLDQSGSMSSAMGQLRTAAKDFVDSFKSMESHPENKMGLVTFASGVMKRDVLKDEFVDDLKAHIGALNSGGYTNSEEALDRAQDSNMGWSDQTGIPQNERTGQYVVFFSDGQPTAFKSAFTRNGSPETLGVVKFDGSVTLAKLDEQNSSLSIGGTNQARPTGNGVGNSRSGNTCGGSWQKSLKWWILDPTYNQDGNGNNVYSVNEPMIYDTPNPLFGANANGCHWKSTLKNYGDLVGQQMAVDHAAEIKIGKEYQIYTIGLGSNIDTTFLGKIATGPEHEFLANTPGDLAKAFSEIANRIKLVLLK